jgi:uncharacterized protein (DUF1800 family)
MSNARHIKHLYARAGFGIRFEDLHNSGNKSVKKAVHKLFKSAEKQEPIVAVTENVDLRYNPRTITDDEKRIVQTERDKQEKALNNAWIKQMSETDAQLREKMTLFWHNHFACNIRNSYNEQQLNNIERDNALGNFKALLLQVSQSPAMLEFLNNEQNRKDHPNENFARELMERFTLGLGHYTEEDVKESARAFTGWWFDYQKTGEFTFKPYAHDNGLKTFLGQTGNFCGEDIIDIIIANKQTAIFICTKLYRYLVNDIADLNHVNQMADVFYKSNYEIKPVLEFMFLSDWFYDDKNIGNLIKSPVEFLVGLNRQFFINYQNPDVLIQFQRTLGQVLFRPPNVGGWPGGTSWIDSSSLMYRMKMPAILLNVAVIDFTGKATPEDEAYLASAQKQQLTMIKQPKALPNWDRFLQAIPQNATKDEIAEFMLEPKLSKTMMDEIKTTADIKQAVIQMVSTPEYQLC